MHGPGERVPVNVWDAGVRVFHWSLAVLVVFNLISGGERGFAFTLHVLAGYTIAALLGFRLVWGVVGSKHARFADFVRGPAVVRDYLARLWRRDPPRSVGHNPAGGWMIVVLLVMLVGLVITGLIGAGRDGAGPLSSLVSRTTARTVRNLHGLLSNLLIALIVVHVLGVIVDWWITRENLVKAMFTGVKDLPAALAAREPPLAPAWLALALGAVALIALGLAWSMTSFPSLPSATQ